MAVVSRTGLLKDCPKANDWPLCEQNAGLGAFGMIQHVSSFVELGFERYKSESPVSHEIHQMTLSLVKLSQPDIPPSRAQGICF